jgi:hypothetical protein
MGKPASQSQRPARRLRVRRLPAHLPLQYRLSVQTIRLCEAEDSDIEDRTPGWDAREELLHKIDQPNRQDEI